MKRQTKRPSPEQVAAIKQHNAATQAQIVWGKPSEIQINRTGALHPEQLKRILKISIFDPWLKLVFGGFFLIFAITQRLESWQFWLPLVISLIPLTMAINGFVARQRIKNAQVETLEGELDDVRQHRSEAVAASLHRDKLYMFLLNYDGAPSLPTANTPYRFYVVFDVIRPGIVLAVESIKSD
ncbi:MAG: hypothetical protein KAX40_00635 [Herpetosiphon sp.]|nr:hypothetical protein [Herpetosiphon sp.]